MQFKLGEIKTKMAWKYLAAWKKGAIIGALFGCLMIYLGIGSLGIINVWVLKFILKFIPETMFIILVYPLFALPFIAYYGGFSGVSTILGILVMSLIMVVFYAGLGSLVGLILGKIMDKIKHSKKERESP